MVGVSSKITLEMASAGEREKQNSICNQGMKAEAFTLPLQFLGSSFSACGIVVHLLFDHLLLAVLYNAQES